MCLAWSQVGRRQFGDLEQRDEAAAREQRLEETDEGRVHGRSHEWLNPPPPAPGMCQMTCYVSLRKFCVIEENVGSGCEIVSRLCPSRGFCRLGVGLWKLQVNMG
ncbi:hypothetical protein KFK09_012047 [Dendrobium nobile]|uniref:Uncharacterized protein n=1 Tax=Dendrobium nobile TaxID=94219 RepID=A0A8T3BGR9_DENNO|nr:hypothetical protein KFK09_012047 [Dendrobium nobile]